MNVKGRGGEVEFDGNFVSIRHTGALGRLTVGKGEKRIPITSITAVHIKPAGAMVNGYIQFTLPGSVERRAGFGKQTFDAAGDENSVIFTKSEESDFLNLRDVIENAIVSRATPQAPVAPIVAGTSKLDELKKLAELRDAGVLSEDEFAEEKARIMGQGDSAIASTSTPTSSSVEAEPAAVEAKDDEAEPEKKKFGIGRIAGAVATGGLTEVGRLAKKRKDRD